MPKTNLNVSCRFDRVVYNDDTAMLINYKSGFKEPDPVQLNPQMRVEAVLVALALYQAGIKPQRFVVQLVTIPFGVFEAEFKWADLRDHYNWIIDTLVQLEDPHAALTPHPDACKRCPAMLICPEINNVVKTTTRGRAAEIAHDPDQLANRLDNLELIQDYIDEFRGYCEAQMNRNDDPAVLSGNEPEFAITGYAMVPGDEMRTWINKEEAERRLFLEPGVTEKDFAVLKSHTVAAYQKIYANAYGKKPHEVKEPFHKLMEGCIEFKNKKASLKRSAGKSAVTQLE